MSGSITSLALAGLCLLVTHFGIASTGLRAMLVRLIGEWPYRGLFSAVALAIFFWLVRAYDAAPYVAVWDKQAWQWFVPLVLMPLASLLVVGGLAGTNPTSVGQEQALDQPHPARGMLRVTRHPLMWGIGLWASAHIVPNGDVASLILFGTLAVLALAGTVLIDAKQRRRRGEAWQRFAAATSNLPLVAVLQGRQDFGAAAREFGWPRLIGAIVLYGVLLHAHRWVIGVSPLPPI